MQDGSKRFVRLTATGGAVSIRSYIDGIKAAKANPDATFKHGLTCWWPCSGAAIVAQYREGLHDRINQAVPFLLRGTPAAAPVRINDDARPVYGPGGDKLAAGRIHRNQAQWRRRLTGKRHLWQTWVEDYDDEPYYVCEGCERRHGVGADDDNYLGPGGHVPLQHLGRDPHGNALIPWCDHPEHGDARQSAAAA